MQFDYRQIDDSKRKFKEFLGEDEERTRKIREAVDDRNFRFKVDINDIRSNDEEWASNIIRNPREYIYALQQAAIEVAKDSNPAYEKLLKTNELQAAFEGSLGANSVTPRGLISNLINNLVEVEGVVTKLSNVRPKLMKSVSYCPKTGKHSSREYRDASSMDIGIEVSENQTLLPTASTFPTVDNDGNELEVEFGLSKYKNYQTLTLQEMPEKARVGQLPRSVEVILEHDLVDKAKPGDRILCTGVFRALPRVQNGFVKTFRTVVMCNNISSIGKEIGLASVTPTDIGNIRELAEKPDVLDVMARSLCPSIYGHGFIKRALILQLLGGMERNLENGTHLRGDINLMLVGDPSTAKSQLLRAVLDVAPLAKSTTGRGSSGVGLTAAVTLDPETGEKRLEAGAMVLSDRGIVCIDEFDKMMEIDRVAIHEVMEQQTVTIAKAGIHATLNARCSVLAAANPVYGQYDTSKRPQDNIGLPDSLLSRFDLLFVVLDTLDPTLDRTLSNHVIRSHQYRRPGTIMEPEPLNGRNTLDLEDHKAKELLETPVWQRGGRNAFSETSQGNQDCLTKEFLRKYIHYAKNKVKPVLSDAAMDCIPTCYSEMRSKTTRKNLPITARTLETIIRLSTASAKARLSNSVDVEDVDVAMELLNFTVFHEPGVSAPTDGGSSGSSGRGGGGGGGGGAASGKKGMEQDDESNTEEQENDDQDDDKEEEEDENEEDYTGMSSVTRGDGRYMQVMHAINKIAGPETDVEEIEIADLMKKLNKALSGQRRYNRKETEGILDMLDSDNKIIYADGTIHIL